MNISIDTRNMRANELALLAAATRGMERRAVKKALKNLVGPELCERLVDTADEFADKLIELDAEGERIHQKAIQISQNNPPDPIKNWN